MRNAPFKKIALASGMSLLLTGIWGGLQAQSPPRNLKLVGDHWTAWDPPAEVAEGADVYIIQRGDTLWDLAAANYGNPYLWPQIWERNQYILDAHWIYPGDPLVMGFEVEPAATLEQPPIAEAVEAPVGPQPLDTMFGRRQAFVQQGTPDDIYCSGYVGPVDEAFPYRVVGSEYEVLGPSIDFSERGKISAVFGAVDAIKVGLTTGDIVYLDGGRSAGLTPGDVFTAVSAEGVIRRPGRSKVVGRYYEYLGRVRVLSVQDDTAIGEVSQSCQPLYIGSMLKPFVPEPIPSERKTPMRPVNEPVSRAALGNAPAILHAKDGIVSIGQDHVVFLELGESDAVEPGDVFTVYRKTVGNNPPVVLGEVAVLSVHPMSSVAKVVESRYPIYVGDLLYPK